MIWQADFAAASARSPIAGRRQRCYNSRSARGIMPTRDAAAWIRRMTTLQDIKKDLPDWPDDVIDQWLLKLANQTGMGWPPPDDR
jgi:hypothetical protein